MLYVIVQNLMIVSDNQIKLNQLVKCNNRRVQNCGIFLFVEFQLRA